MRADDEALRLHRLEWCDRVLAWNAQRHTEEEQKRAIERAAQDARDLERRHEPEQQTLTLAA